MAGEVIASLLIKLGLRTDELEAGLGKAQKSVSGFGKGTDLAMGLAAGAVAGALMSTVDAAREWETAFAGVKKTVDTTGLSVDQQTQVFAGLEDGLRDLAKTIPITATELAGLAEAGGALGIARQDLVEFARVTAIIGTTTDVVAQDAATSLGKIGTVIGLTADDYDNFGAALVDLGNKGASFESEILETANRISGTSKLIGLSADEMLGWAAAMANVGILPEAAGGSFQVFARTIQQASILGTNKLDVIAKTAGMTREAFQELWDTSSSQALTAFLAGMSELSEKEQMLATGFLGLGKIRIGDFMSKLTGNIDNVTSSLSNADTGWTQNTAMMIEAEKRFETLDSGMQMFWNRVNDVAITLGRTLMPVLRGSVEHLGNLADMLGDALKAFPQVTNVVTPLVTALSGLIALRFGARFLTSMIPGADQFAGAMSKSLEGSRVAAVFKRAGLSMGRVFGLAAAVGIAAILADELGKQFRSTQDIVAKIGKGAEVPAAALGLSELEGQMAAIDKGLKDLGNDADQTLAQTALNVQHLFFGGEAVDLSKVRADLEKRRAVLFDEIRRVKDGIRSEAGDPTLRDAWAQLLDGPQRLMAQQSGDEIKRWLQGSVDAVAGFVNGIHGVAPEVKEEFVNVAQAIRSGFGSVKAALQGGNRIIDPDTRLKNMRSRLSQATANLRKAIQVGDPIAEDYWRAAVAKAGLTVDGFWNRIHGTTQRKSKDTADTGINQAERMHNRMRRVLSFENGQKIMQAYYDGMGSAVPVGSMPNLGASPRMPAMHGLDAASRGTVVNLHVGTLVADDHGLRELDRRMRRASRLASRDRG